MTTLISADASATRAFFVDMLIRDISIDGAIFDLIDNAVDAAYSHSSQRKSLAGCRIDMSISEDAFKIHDNCGGIDIDIARDYAFRFGRATGFSPSTRIGEFGIGMKRAIFRLGRHFIVDSSTSDTRFTMEVDIEEWRREDGEWTFPMTIEDTPAPESGTSVIVRSLHEGVREVFAHREYKTGILREIAERYNEAIREDLEIVVNGTPVDVRLHQILSGSGITPLNESEQLDSDGRTVDLQVIAGIGHDRRPGTESGWNVYCNGRLVLKADRTELTGWGTDDPESGSGIPAWHPQYARFRGFVYFRSEHPAALPWTTTKTEIDEHSAVYRNALGKMRSAIRSFSRFTNELKNEREDFEESDGSLPLRIADALNGASYRRIDEVSPSIFEVPERSVVPRVPSGPRMTNIHYKAEVSRVEDLKDALHLSTNRQVGETAFERLYSEEIE